jgi:hypothetical protein
MVDFKELKTRISIEEGAKLLGCALKQSGEQLRGVCPKCGGSDRTLAITPAKGVYFCFAEKRGGDVLALASHIRGVTVHEAALFLSGGTNSPAPATPSPPRAARDGSAFDAGKYLASLDPEAENPYGLTAETLRDFGAGYSSSGILRGTLAIALRDQTGTILGFMGVKQGEPTKYPRDFDPRQVLFGADRVTQPEVRLVADPITVMTCAQYGEEAICWLTELIEAQQDELMACIKHEKSFKTFKE